MFLFQIFSWPIFILSNICMPRFLKSNFRMSNIFFVECTFEKQLICQKKFSQFFSKILLMNVFYRSFFCREYFLCQIYFLNLYFRLCFCLIIGYRECFRRNLFCQICFCRIFDFGIFWSRIFSLSNMKRLRWVLFIILYASFKKKKITENIYFVENAFVVYFLVFYFWSNMLLSIFLDEISWIWKKS